MAPPLSEQEPEVVVRQAIRPAIRGLLAVINVWPEVPEAVRADIVAKRGRLVAPDRATGQTATSEERPVQFVQRMPAGEPR